CKKLTINSTSPEQLTSRNKLISPLLCTRVNGWSLPLHSFLYFNNFTLNTIGNNCIWAHNETSWTGKENTPSYFDVFLTCNTGFGVFFLHHFLSHLVATTTDPAEPNVLAKKKCNNSVAVFDRSKHKHAIQNQHCYLCEPKGRHCSACSKCIADFDHHCKWFNSCVGGRNYWFFFSAVASAVLDVFLLMLLLVFVTGRIKHSVFFPLCCLSRSQGNNTWLTFLPFIPVEVTAAGILVVMVVMILLGSPSLLCLGHLLVFHFYLRKELQLTCSNYFQKKVLEVCMKLCSSGFGRFALISLMTLPRLNICVYAIPLCA
uniref:Palmitoyltransferase n=1 Tax=Apteryx owenii TaxID=8824 RepID=A0A8B9QQ38_APTOW